VGLSEALSIAQGQFQPIIKNKHVDFNAGGSRVKYSYAALSSILDAVRKPLSDNKLALTQTIGYLNGNFGLITTLMFEQEKIESFVDLPSPKDVKPQQFGSFLTYFRRYSISCILGLESEDDDDGTQAQEAPPKDEVKPKPKNFAPMSLMDQIADIAKSKGLSNKDIGDAIKLSTGKLKSSECSDTELMTVIAYLKMK